MRQQFIGLQHCKCGMSWKKDIGFFERTNDMVFVQGREADGKKENCNQMRFIAIMEIQFSAMAIFMLKKEEVNEIENQKSG